MIMSCYSNKIESVSPKKSLAYQQSVLKRYDSFTYKIAVESSGIDMEQNYVTVTLCIKTLQITAVRKM